MLNCYTRSLPKKKALESKGSADDKDHMLNCRTRSLPKGRLKVAQFVMSILKAFLQHFFCVPFELPTKVLRNVERVLYVDDVVGSPLKLLKLLNRAARLRPALADGSNLLAPFEVFSRMPVTIEGDELAEKLWNGVHTTERRTIFHAFVVGQPSG
mmetsp:Transcript_80999/g.153648  ORF Transcript_80999/g.153648 Transcript_80999/m.153648 type:complete len:155 (-) Transcript_80999:699-1163(-)